MSPKKQTRPKAEPVQATPTAPEVSKLLQRYGCGPFVGTENAFYERHLLFDRAIDPVAASARERF
jgi:starch phosphorylase